MEFMYRRENSFILPLAPSVHQTLFWDEKYIYNIENNNCILPYEKNYQPLISLETN